jgi:peptidoglycan/xylan/chitin deacetylase (PgdA/CDA1 family)
MAVAVTLDDGYADNHSDAWPILAEQGFPATVFVTVNTVGDQNRWMMPDGYPSRRMLSWAQIQELHAAGIQIGSHTLTHPRLSTLGRDAARHEVVAAKKALEDRLGEPVDTFAYPYGDLSDETREVVGQAGHSIACSIRPGFNRPDDDPLLLRRIEIQGTDPAWKVLQKLRFGSNKAGVFEPMKYYLKRAINRLGID